MVVYHLSAWLTQSPWLSVRDLITLSMTRPAAWLSVRRDSDPGEFKIAVRSFNCMNLISASGSSSLGRRFAIPCMAEALSRAMLGHDTRKKRLCREEKRNASSCIHERNALLHW